MKKVVFAIQVFGFIAAFPLYVIVELNHVSAPLIQAERSSNAIKDQKKPVSTESKYATVEFDYQYLGFKVN